MKTRLILGIFVMLSLCANVNAQQQRQRTRQPQNAQRQQVNKPQQQKPVHMHSEKTCIIPEIHYNSKENISKISYTRSNECKGYLHVKCEKVKKGNTEVDLKEKLDYKSNEGTGLSTKEYVIGKGDFHEWKAIIQIPNKNSSEEDKKEKILHITDKINYPNCCPYNCDGKLDKVKDKNGNHYYKTTDDSFIYYYKCLKCKNTSIEVIKYR